ncbi:hypothetical protein TRVL_04521 [Trypanosoma vivax]|nr:hypothetical protein TRVL_04521 [Trypanosoma vivax]
MKYQPHTAGLFACTLAPTETRTSVPTSTLLNCSPERSFEKTPHEKTRHVATVSPGFAFAKQASHFLPVPMLTTEGAEKHATERSYNVKRSPDRTKDVPVALSEAHSVLNSKERVVEESECNTETLFRVVSKSTGNCEPAASSAAQPTTGFHGHKEGTEQISNLRLQLRLMREGSEFYGIRRAAASRRAVAHLYANAHNCALREIQQLYEHPGTDSIHRV